MLFSSAVFLGLYLLISLLDSSSIQRNFSYTYNQIKASDEKIMIFSTQHETIYKSAFEMFKHNIFFWCRSKKISESYVLKISITSKQILINLSRVPNTST